MIEKDCDNVHDPRSHFLVIEDSPIYINDTVNGSWHVFVFV